MFIKPSFRSLLGLELLRFACTLPVLIWHYQHFYFVAGKQVGFEVSEQPFYDWLEPFYLHGFLAVQMFWALSGFIFYWKYAASIASKQVSLKQFAWRRISRLYPLHWLTLFVVAALGIVYERQMGAGFVYQNQDWLHFVRQLFMVNDWGVDIAWSFNGPIWSVSLELLVYLAFFGLSWLGGIQWGVSLGVIALTGVIYVAKWTPHPLVLCLFFFYLGALTCQVGGYLQRRFSAAVYAGMLLLGAVALGAIGTFHAAEKLKPMHWLALSAPVIILGLVQLVQPQSARMKSTVMTLGQLTYSSYLWHFPVQLAAAVYFMGTPSVLPASSPAWFLAYLATTYVIAFFSYRWFEVPAQNYLRRWVPSA